MLDGMAEELCLAIQQERVAAVPAILTRLEGTVRDLLTSEDPAELRAATDEILRRAIRLATVSRQSALSSLSRLPTQAGYQTAGGSCSTWKMNG